MNTPVRLLIVDGHVLIRLGLVALLADQADIAIVGEACNGCEALAMHAELQPDLTLMEGMLDDIHGADVTTRILMRDPAASIIFVSINESGEDIHRAIGAGARGYVAKSQSKEVILSAIRAVMSGESYLSPELARRLSIRASTKCLSQREIDVLRLIAKGLVNKQIADQLALSENTVKTHIARIMGKLEVHDRTSLAMKAVTLGILR